MKENHSLRPVAVNFGWVIVAAVKTAERHLTVTVMWQSCRAHVHWGRVCRLHWQQRQTGGQKNRQLERKWCELFVWSKKNFTINKTLSSCWSHMFTRPAQAARSVGVPVFWWFGLYSGKHPYKHKAGFEVLLEPKPKVSNVLMHSPQPRSNCLVTVQSKVCLMKNKKNPENTW